MRVEGDATTPERTIVFSGDLGRPGAPILRDYTAVTEADYVLVETTYGGREHQPEQEALRVLAETIRLVSDSKGVLLIPSFAIGRTQDIVYELDRLIDAGQIPLLPLYLDSPMGSKATDIYRRHTEYYDTDAAAVQRAGETPLDYPKQIITNDVKDSQQIARAQRPYMIVASNGMLTGGRVVGHLRDLIGDPNATILFVGYQGVGTLGAASRPARRPRASTARLSRCTARSSRSAASLRTPTSRASSRGSRTSAPMASSASSWSMASRTRRQRSSQRSTRSACRRISRAGTSASSSTERLWSRRARSSRSDRRAAAR